MKDLKPRVPLNVEFREDSHETVDALGSLQSEVSLSKLTEPDRKEAAVLERGLSEGLVRKPHIDTLLSNAYITLHAELVRMRNRSLDVGLEPQDFSSFEKLTNSLTKLAKEEREQHKAERLDDLTDDELRKIANGEE